MQRRIAVFLTVVFAFTNILFAYQPEKSIWQERQKQLKLASVVPTIPKISSIVKPVLLTRPTIHGLPGNLLSHVRIAERHDAGSSLRVLLLQDIHQNNEAQRHLAGAIKKLARAGVEKEIVVGLEGTEGKLPYALYRSLPNKELGDAVAESFFESGEISGPVYAALTTYPQKGGSNLHFHGVEETALYDRNVAAYKSSHADKPAVQKQLKTSRHQITQEKKTVYNPALMALDQSVQAYRSGKMSLADYLPPLVQTGAPVGQVALFLEASRFEKSMDMRRIEPERNYVLEKLTSKLSKEELEILVARSQQVQRNEETFASYYNYFKNLCAAQQIDLAKTPAFNNYIRYVLLTDRIHPETLFNETRQLEEKALASLAKTPAEKNLVRNDRALFLKERLVEFSLTPEEWKEYKTSHAPAAAGEAFEAFYEVAEARNEKMVQNLLAASEKSKMAVLVAGGFHTNGITALLKKKGISYVTAVPKIETVDANQGTSYLTVFDREKTPLEQMFAGRKLFLSDNPNRHLNEVVMTRNALHDSARLDQSVVSYNGVAAYVNAAPSIWDRLFLRRAAESRVVGEKIINWYTQTRMFWWVGLGLTGSLFTFGVAPTVFGAAMLGLVRYARTSEEEPAELKTLEAFAPELLKEKEEPGSGNTEEIIFISDEHGTIDKFDALILHALRSTKVGKKIPAGFRFKPDEKYEVQLQSIGLSLANFKRQIFFHNLGDFMDRGPYGIRIFEHSVELIEAELSDFVIGNHDHWMFMNLLGFHLPWYDRFNFYGYKDRYDASHGNIEDLLTLYRNQNSKLLSPNWWAEKLAEYTLHQKKLQDSDWAKAINAKINGDLDENGKHIPGTGLFAEVSATLEPGSAERKMWDQLRGWDLVDVYTGTRGIGMVSLVWWENLLAQMKEAHKNAEETPADAAWAEAIRMIEHDIIPKLQSDIEARLEAGDWWWRVFEAINSQNYTSPEWWAKDWIFHPGWGPAILAELNNMLRPGEEEVTIHNYLTHPVLERIAFFYKSNFNLYVKDQYQNVGMHAFLPVDMKTGEFHFTYKGIEYRGKGVWAGLDIVSKDIREEPLLFEISEAMALVNSWYADNTTQAKPPHVAQTINKFGPEKLARVNGFNRLFTGHVPFYEFSKISTDKLGIISGFNVRDQIFFTDHGKGKKFGGRGGYVRTTPDGIQLVGFEHANSSLIVENPRTVTTSPGINEGVEEVLFFNPTYPRERFLPRLIDDVNARIKALREKLPLIGGLLLVSALAVSESKWFWMLPIAAVLSGGFHTLWDLQQPGKRGFSPWIDDFGKHLLVQYEDEIWIYDLFFTLDALQNHDEAGKKAVRQRLLNSRLAKLIRSGVVGQTSNQSIFLKGVKDGFYDHEIIKLRRALRSDPEELKKLLAPLKLIGSNTSVETLRTLFKTEEEQTQLIYNALYRLVTKLSATTFRMVSEEVARERDIDLTNSPDWMVSHETDPVLAMSKDGVNAIIKEAKELQKLDGNVLVKIAIVGPGRGEKMDQNIARIIRECVRAGVIPNITLDFSPGLYVLSTKAILEGLMDRLKDMESDPDLQKIKTKEEIRALMGKEVYRYWKVVNSFFFSRPDVHSELGMDRWVGTTDPRLKGKFGLAMGRAVHRISEYIFKDESFTGAYRKNFDRLFPGLLREIDAAHNIAMEIQHKSGIQPFTRFLAASTGNKNEKEYSSVLYIITLIADAWRSRHRSIVNTLPASALNALTGFLSRKGIPANVEATIFDGQPDLIQDGTTIDAWENNVLNKWGKRISDISVLRMVARRLKSLDEKGAFDGQDGKLHPFKKNALERRGPYAAVTLDDVGYALRDVAAQQFAEDQQKAYDVIRNRIRQSDEQENEQRASNPAWLKLLSIGALITGAGIVYAAAGGQINSMAVSFVIAGVVGTIISKVSFGKTWREKSDEETLRDLGITFDPRFHVRALRLIEKGRENWDADDKREYEALVIEARIAYDWTVGWIRQSRYYQSIKDNPPAILTLEAMVSAIQGELGLSLTTFAGGLGVLSGDWFKALAYLGASSDMEPGAPLFTVFLPNYIHGVKVLKMDAFDWPFPEARYSVRPQQDPVNAPELFHVNIPVANGSPVRVGFRGIGVGPLRILMIETSANGDPVGDGENTLRELYQGELSTEERFKQEWVIGLAAYEARRTLGLPAGPVHLNETATFAYLIGMIRGYVDEYVRKGASLSQAYDLALEMTGKQTIFFTHTLVSAGIDRFPREIDLQKYIIEYFSQSELDPDMVSKQDWSAVASWITVGKEDLPGLFHRNQILPLNFIVKLIYAFTGGSVVAVSRRNATKAAELFIAEGILTAEQVAKRGVKWVTNGVDLLFWMQALFVRIMNLAEPFPEKRTPWRILDPADPQANRVHKIVTGRDLPADYTEPALSDEDLTKELQKSEEDKVDMVRRTVWAQYMRNFSSLRTALDNETRLERKNFLRNRYLILKKRWESWAGAKLPGSLEGFDISHLRNHSLNNLLSIQKDDLSVTWARRLVQYKRMLLVVFGERLPEVEARVDALLDRYKHADRNNLDVVIHQDQDFRRLFDDLVRDFGEKAFERFSNLVINKNVRFVFAGNAFSGDGRAMVWLLHRLVDHLAETHGPEMLNRVIYLEGYNDKKAQFLVQGSDLWLNTPRPPEEASGTSGMKKARPLTALDGWAYSFFKWLIGFSFGPRAGLSREHPHSWPEHEKDPAKIREWLESEAASLYAALNEAIDLKVNNPKEWIRQYRRWTFFQTVYDIRGEFTGRQVPDTSEKDPETYEYTPDDWEPGILALYDEGTVAGKKQAELNELRLSPDIVKSFKALSKKENFHLVGPTPYVESENRGVRVHGQFTIKPELLSKVQLAIHWGRADNLNWTNFTPIPAEAIKSNGHNSFEIDQIIPLEANGEYGFTLVAIPFGLPLSGEIPELKIWQSQPGWNAYAFFKNAIPMGAVVPVFGFITLNETVLLWALMTALYVGIPFLAIWAARYFTNTKPTQYQFALELRDALAANDSAQLEKSLAPLKSLGLQQVQQFKLRLSETPANQRRPILQELFIRFASVGNENRVKVAELETSDLNLLVIGETSYEHLVEKLEAYLKTADNPNAENKVILSAYNYEKFITKLSVYGRFHFVSAENIDYSQLLRRLDKKAVGKVNLLFENLEALPEGLLEQLMASELCDRIVLYLLEKGFGGKWAHAVPLGMMLRFIETVQSQA